MLLPLCRSVSDPEYSLMPKDNDPFYEYAHQVVQDISQNTDVDPTNGAHYYANLKNTTSGWFFSHIVSDKVNHPITAEIGHHTFFK